MIGAGPLLVFGCGYLGEVAARRALARGQDVMATSRQGERRQALQTLGIEALDPEDADALAQGVKRASAIIVTAPPDAGGCPGARALIPALSRTNSFPDWIGYVSSTGVYGDRAGGWVFEDGALNAASLEGARRVRAEREWLDTGRGLGLTVQLFRLPGIYGPGRSVVDRLRANKALLVRKPGQIFNRIHVRDAARALDAAMANPRPSRAYNVVDDEPAPADKVMEWAAQRLGLALPQEVCWTDERVSDAMRRFYRDSKRVSNARAKAELGWRPDYPSWREGLEAIIASEPLG